MTEHELVQILRDEIGRLAPEVEFDSVDRRAPIQQEFDIDSMDFLNLVTALHERLGVNVPESDYSHVATIDGAVSYLRERLSGQPPQRQ